MPVAGRHCADNTRVAKWKFLVQLSCECCSNIEKLQVLLRKRHHGTRSHGHNARVQARQHQYPVSRLFRQAAREPSSRRWVDAAAIYLDWTTCWMWKSNCWDEPRSSAMNSFPPGCCKRCLIKRDSLAASVELTTLLVRGEWRDGKIGRLSETVGFDDCCWNVRIFLMGAGSRPAGVCHHSYSLQCRHADLFLFRRQSGLAQRPPR